MWRNCSQTDPITPTLSVSLGLCVSVCLCLSTARVTGSCRRRLNGIGEWWGFFHEFWRQRASNFCKLFHPLFGNQSEATPLLNIHMVIFSCYIKSESLVRPVSVVDVFGGELNAETLTLVRRVIRCRPFNGLPRCLWIHRKAIAKGQIVRTNSSHLSFKFSASIALKFGRKANTAIDLVRHPIASH